MVSSHDFIRIAEERDISALVSLCEELGYPTSPEQMRHRFAEVTRQKHDGILVAEDSTGKVVGFIHIRLRQLLLTELTAEICGLVVKEGLRGRGFGKALMAAAEEWAARNGCNNVSLRSNVSRQAAHAFYITNGFKITKTQYAFSKKLE